MKSFFNFLVSALLFTAPNVQAQSTEAARFLNDRSHYEVGNCTSNIADLANRLKSEGVNLSEAKVIYILYERVHRAGLPMKIQKMTAYNHYDSSLPGYLQVWDFHVVLELNGRIMDYDNFNTNGLPDPEAYFSKMFLGGDVKSLSQIYIRPVPALEFLRESATLNNDALLKKYKFENVEQIVSVSDYLARFHGLYQNQGFNTSIPSSCQSYSLFFSRINFHCPIHELTSHRRPHDVSLDRE
jgi:hypothetical protein